MMKKTTPLLGIILMAAACVSTPASAILIESWENTGVAGLNGATGPWAKAENAPAKLAVAFSDLHATEGKYSLAVTTPGGWANAVINVSNNTSALGDKTLRASLAEKRVILIDVFADKSLGWSSLSMAINGNNMEWTQYNSDALRMGGKTTVKFTIPAKALESLKADNQWFQFCIMVNTSGAGTLYLDNLRVE